MIEERTDSISVFGRFWSPRVFSAYYTLFSKSRRFLPLINDFLRLRLKKAWDGKKSKQLEKLPDNWVSGPVCDFRDREFRILATN